MWEIAGVTIKVQSFPISVIESETWVKALLSILLKTPTKDMVVCIKFWSVNYRIYKKKSGKVPADPFYFFHILFLRILRKKGTQTVSPDSKLGKSKILKKTIGSWKSLETFCSKLDLVQGEPPRIKLSFQIFKDCTISSVIKQKVASQNRCYKKTRHTKFFEKRTFCTP